MHFKKFTFSICTILLGTMHLTSFENDERKTVWFLAGHMQDIFSEEYLKPMLNSGYDLTPLHRLHKTAAHAGYDLKVADPNAIKLMPFSHKNSGIPEVAKKGNQELSPEDYLLLQLLVYSDSHTLHEEKNGNPLTNFHSIADSLKNFEYIIVFDVMFHQLDYLSKYPKEKLILFLWEPPSVMPQNYHLKNHEIFSKIFTWNDDLVDNKKYFKFFYPVLHPMVTDAQDFDAKKLCILIGGNKTSKHPKELYTERRKVLDFFDQDHCEDFDLYGNWWPSTYKTYKGATNDKIGLLKHYKFCFAYENIKDIPGYVTEKIFDAFQAGCVPIYLGASNIQKYIPQNCFIDRNDFKTEEELYSFLKNMSNAEYLEYIKNIQTYLTSPQAQLFSSDHFVKTVMDLITSQ